MLKLLKIINTLNIDTALGAVSFVLMVSFVRKVEVNSSIYLALSISVLFIYNLDHLVDAYRLKSTKSSFRHSFYKRYFTTFVIWQVLLLIVGVWSLFQLSLPIIYAGLFMSAAIGLYFLIIFTTQYKNYLLREVIVAAGYAYSVAAIPFAASQNTPELNFYGLLLIIFLIALTNLWVFALFDYKVDKGQNHHSIALSVANKKLYNMTKMVIGVTLLIIVLYVVYHKFWLLGIALVSIELMYFVMLKNKQFYQQNEYYRIVGELILILPGSILLAAYAI